MYANFLELRTGEVRRFSLLGNSLHSVGCGEMKTFLRVAAILVSLGNWYVLTTGGNPAVLVEYGWSIALQSLFVGAVVGLLVAEVLIRGMRPLVEGGFLARYVAMAGAVFVGGMMYGALLPFSMLLFSGMPSDTPGVPNLLEQIFLGLGAGIFGALGGPQWVSRRA
jgi:hypothetical protein